MNNEENIQSLLKNTYFPFFRYFGGLTNIQVYAIPEILKGKNAIVVSPSASGKTEAVIAPIVERIISEGEIFPFSVVYVVPTKALVNDIEKRISSPLGELEISVGVRTADRRELKIKKPQTFIITTPESLDSMLCRHSYFFSNIKCLVLDELHLIHGNYRGDQLRCLIGRIEKWHSKKEIQFVALSATIEKPFDVASMYFKNAFVIKEEGIKPFKIKLVDDLIEGVNFLKENNRNKFLVFANSRKEVEILSGVFKNFWPSDRILVHHGSLSKKQRHEVERVMREWKWGICIATTTLELGIDIGDINAVLLYGSPPLPSTFLQRIGRGCRREKEIIAVCFYRNDTERKEFLNLAEIIMSEKIEEKEYYPDISVVVQQIFSILYGNPQGKELDKLFEITQILCDEDKLVKILTHLVEIELIEKKGGKYYATTLLMDMGEKGVIHSNIPDEKKYELKDILTGKIIGEITISANIGSNIPLGGYVWEVIAKEKRQLIVRKIGDILTMPKFKKRPSSGAFYKYLPEELKNLQKV